MKINTTLVVLALLSGVSRAQISAPGLVVEVYATAPAPQQLAFDATTGELYAGQDGGPGSGVPVSRIPAGGGAGQPFGPDLFDPDGVLVDSAGCVSQAGSLLVARGSTLGYPTGQVDAIHPSNPGVAIPVVLPSATHPNPNGLAFAGSGELLVLSDHPNGPAHGGSLHRAGCGTTSASEITTLGDRHGTLVVDAAGRILTLGFDGIIRVFDESGNVLDPSLASGLGTGWIPMAIGPGTAPWGGDVYVIEKPQARLLRVDSSGNSSVVGTGFTDDFVGATFGPDNALYLSDRGQDRILRLAPLPCIGDSYCTPASPSSTGSPGVLCAAGDPGDPLNGLTLRASSLPVGQFGYFLASRTQGMFMPTGSQGTICLSGNIGRFNAPSQIIQGPTGSLLLDLGAIPVNPPVAVQSGDTWNFQCWFRDVNPGPTSNFTDAVTVVFP